MLKKYLFCFVNISLFIFLFSTKIYPYSYSLSKKASYLLYKADKCRRSLYRSKKKKKNRINWIICIHKYRTIYRLYPASPQAPWAIYHAANLYLNLYRYSGKKRDLDYAINLFKWLVERYPKHRLADDAQYKIGWIFYKYKHQLQKAYVEFLKIEIRFPKGDMLPKAKRMLDKLAVLLTKKDTERLKKTVKKKRVALKDIRHWATSTYTRVVIDLERSANYTYKIVKKQNSTNLILFINNAFIPYNRIIEQNIKQGILKCIKANLYKNDIVKVALELKYDKINSYNIFHLYDPFRIVIDIGKREISSQIRASKTKTKTKAFHIKRHVRKGIRKVKKFDKTISLARQLGLNVRRIVIDPGHGGKDPGCIWRGIKEKDITLRIAKILAKKLKKELNCKVYLTRTKDVYLSLERRTAIANMKKADLFISIHVNAHRNRRIRGVETYFLNMATDERAILVAARENATSEKNISDLQSIISDLMLNTKIHESNQLAYDIQKGIISTLKKRYKYIGNLGVKQGPFYVLVGARMPAVLVEVGFITNRLERRRLLSTKYEESIAEGICRGIKKYIKGMEKIAQTVNE